MTNTCDTGFAHAVRLAATGIRPKAGADVIAEAGPLREILCRERTLDPNGLELLALAVTGKLRKIKQPSCETEFAHAVRRASAAWRKGKNDGPADVGALLAETLRLGRPVLGSGEREELAELFSPKIPSTSHAFVGRPCIGAGKANVVAVVEMLRNEREKGSARKNAIIDTAKRFRISCRTVEKYDSMIEERESICASMEALYGSRSLD
ncbi:hypothetical protein [Sulfitobacter sp. CW3]|uniref:hypothetical protein n=1 Tax=Sulfitobacter sp. CW3 TaxID=2861965 RepID=UPI001C6001BD|nr:hypothetical protein [Sulfitobacter sp. CW3]MBW4962174.1 hypothetical protein [Sulfitobacter sp. CW3]